jgi:ABC-2 type transport system permease protein
LIVGVDDVERDTPVLVQALVAAGAPIVDVRTETPGLEEVYLRLVSGDEPVVPVCAEPDVIDRDPERGAGPAVQLVQAGWPAVVRKEIVDLIRNRAALLPIAISMVAFVALPLFVAVVLPAFSGEPLGDDADLAKVSLAAGGHPELTVNGRVQLFLFEQFLTVFLLMPITGAMTLAAHAVVGEKLARTLEPLLATPLTTAELLVAKMVGAFAPTVAIAAAGLAVYLALIQAAAEPGVMTALVNARTFVLTLLTGPAAALVALQSAILVSARVNDPRTAQQVGVLIILPLTAVIIAQFTGALWVNAATLAFAALGLFGLWILLVLASVSLFERETILTKWR